MKKSTILGASSLTAATPLSLAQEFDVEDQTDEGRLHLSLAPDRAVTRACSKVAEMERHIISFQRLIDRCASACALTDLHGIKCLGPGQEI